MKTKIFILIFFSLFIFHVSYVHSQQVHQEWVARYPGPSNDYTGPFLQVDKSGNSYLAGTHIANDSLNILCVKYDTYGNQQWAVLYKYPGYGYFAPTGLALDSTGNAYVISGFGLNSLTPRNMIIIKYNSLNGSVIWVKKYIGEYYESSFFDIKIDRQNNIYVVGGSDTAHLVIRYNTNGDSVWVKKFHPTSYREVASACTIDDSLNIIFTGQRIFYYYSAEYDSLLTVKYSPNGVLRWERAYGYDFASNWGTKITVDQNGNLYIGGGTNISGDAVYLTLKYDRNGVQQWIKIFQGPGNGISILRDIILDRINNALFVSGGAQKNGLQMATTIKYNTLTGDSLWVRQDSGTCSRANTRKITLDTTGNLYLTGETYNSPSFVPYDVLTIKYSSAGSPIWRIAYNGQYNGLDIGIDIGLDSYNNVYVMGLSPDWTQVTDYIIIKYSQLNGIKPIFNETPFVYKLLQNFPNPFNPYTKIKFFIPKTSFIQLKIYDVLGKIKEVVVNQQLQPSEYETIIDASNYSSGVYFYQLTADENIIDTKKMMLVK